MDEVPLDNRLLFIILLYSTLAITGLLGNLWVMFTVSSQLAGCVTSPGGGSGPGGRHTSPAVLKYTVQTSAYIYLLVLSVVDLCSFVSVPLLVTDIIQNKWPFSQSLCKLLFACEGLNKSLSPLVLTALSLDRYIAVCRPTLLYLRQTRFALCATLLCFGASLFFIAPVTLRAGLTLMINTKLEEIEKCVIDIPLGDAFDLAHCVACYFLPLFLICSVYIAILRKLYRHTRFSTVGRKTSISLSRVVRCSVMVVAFYFICWTPYWTSRFFEFIKPVGADSDDPEPEMEPSINLTTISYSNGSESFDYNSEETDANSAQSIVFMYLLHSLPYAQSAFNWLFYAFLNRNLRNSGRGGGGSHTARSTAPPTSGLFENPLAGGSNGAVASTPSTTPLWKNLQQMGNQLRNAGIDTGHLILKRSPFRSRSRVQSRSSTYLGVNEVMLGDSHVCTSLLDVTAARTLSPRLEPRPVVTKCVSFNDLPRNGNCKLDSNDEGRRRSEEAPPNLLTVSPDPLPFSDPDPDAPSFLPPSRPRSPSHELPESTSVEWL